MGKIMKYGMERLGHRKLEVRLDCPNCGSARICFYSGNGKEHINDTSCPKCGTRVILDGVSITTIHENADTDVLQSSEPGKAESIV